ncbi:MAG: hypothetical protein JXA78_11945 [Anaerolineales bacterium]|nr:hypothetical protein [Anaerolineales bacterium]
MVSAYDYNQAGWLEGLSHSRDGELLSSFLYGCDQVGNRTTATETMYVLYTYTYLPLLLDGGDEGGEAMGGGEAETEGLTAPAEEKAYPAPETEEDSLAPAQKGPTPTPTDSVYPTPETKDETSFWQKVIGFLSGLFAWITPNASAHAEPVEAEKTLPVALQTALPEGGVYTKTIEYVYDPLYRLTNAIYSTGPAYTYTLDAMGNRLMLQTGVYTNTYLYDEANRLTHVNGITQTWDANGNLLHDGVYRCNGLLSREDWG